MQRRNTVQKELVLKAVRELKCHAAAEEVFERVRESCPSVSRGTVYRNLNVLAEEGSLLKVEVPGDADRYDHFTQPHYHARCIRCGKVFDVEMDVISDMGERVRGPKGFTFLGWDVVFKGICPECGAAADAD